jgi:type IV pilus assembly protein PilN
VSNKFLPTINLLPYHGERKARRRQRVMTGLGIAALAGAAVVVIGGIVIDRQTSAANRLNAVLSAENARLDTEIAEVTSLRKEIDELLHRQNAVESLQIKRNRPVQLLEELVRVAPEGVFFKTLRQDDERFTVVGIAQSNERVSQVLRNISEVPWLANAELLETKAITMTNNLKEQRRLFEFSLRFGYRPPQPPASGTSAVPGAAGKGA